MLMLSVAIFLDFIAIKLFRSSNELGSRLLAIFLSILSLVIFYYLIF